MSVNVERIAKDIDSVLEAEGVHHESLFLVAKNNNYAFTDGKHVFVKVSVVSDSTALEREVSFLQSFGSSITKPSLLVHKAVTLLDGANHAVVYRFEDIAPIPESSLKVGSFTVEGMGEGLRRIHSLPVEGFTGWSLNAESIADKIVPRLEFIRGLDCHEMFAEQIREYEAIMDKFMSSEWLLSSLSGSRKSVVCHGDSHLGNFGMSGDDVILFDFESTILAPMEYDLTGLVLDLGYTRGKWDVVREFVGSFDSVDVEVLECLVFVKVLTSSSFLLLSAPDDSERSLSLFSRRVESLEEGFAARKLLAYCK